LAAFGPTVRAIKQGLPDLQDALYGQPYRTTDSKLAEVVDKASKEWGQDKDRLFDLENERDSKEGLRREKSQELARTQTEYAQAKSSRDSYKASLEDIHRRIRALEQAQAA
jgi:chromosome segregation ATPase